MPAVIAILAIAITVFAAMMLKRRSADLAHSAHSGR
jgi:hypothetical protein